MSCVDSLYRLDRVGDLRDLLSMLAARTVGMWTASVVRWEDCRP